jgi:hypothetical protein
MGTEKLFPSAAYPFQGPMTNRRAARLKNRINLSISFAAHGFNVFAEAPADRYGVRQSLFGGISNLHSFKPTLAQSGRAVRVRELVGYDSNPGFRREESKNWQNHQHLRSIGSSYPGVSIADVGSRSLNPIP